MSVRPPRASGIILHPTSLPGPFGIGDIGPGAHRFLRFLSQAGQSLWQVLPVGPTGFGDSPYACFSSFAGNPLLLSPEALADWGLLTAEELHAAPDFPADAVDYGAVIAWKMPVLRTAAARFLTQQESPLWERFTLFQTGEAGWLDDFCLFMAVKHDFETAAAASGKSAGAWNTSWTPDIALRQTDALASFEKKLAREIQIERVIQFFFFEQWSALRTEAARNKVLIIGDLPIFAAPDSADVWANRTMFRLDAAGRPTVVSGVPPDYFARTGQLWGNPLYDWEALSRENYRFWVERIRSARKLFDFIRIDHFRGFEASWTVPAGESTAERGRWIKAPGESFFNALLGQLGELPLIAEDLGVITPEVSELREHFGFPGMRVLQFAFDSVEAGSLNAGNRFLPHNHAPDSVVYTGTHDNDTTRGWFSQRTAQERDYLGRYAGLTLGELESQIEWVLIRMALASVCRFALFPLQDVLGLGRQARLNTPGTSGGSNWRWRFRDGDLTEDRAGRLRELSVLYGRGSSGPRLRSSSRLPRPSRPSSAPRCVS
jgi:4-alpha-glucanotransferase